MSSITSEAQQIANDPSFAVQFAIGDPFPKLVPQNRNDDSDDNVRLRGVYFEQPKRYLLKKARFSTEDKRIFDVDTGLVVMVSSHVGKNPYEEVDILDFNEASTGEWKSITDVSCVNGNYPSFKIRPKKLSRHGTQYIDLHGDNEDVVLNISKMSKLKSKSMRPHFVVGREKKAGKGRHMIYKLVADIAGRTLAIENRKGELVAQMAKTKTALLKTAIYGGGSESTIDIAPGVDCSTILALVFAVGQVGKHYVKDAFNNFVIDPLQDAAVDHVFDSLTGGGGDGGGGEEDDGVFDEAVDKIHEGAGDAFDGAGSFAGDVAEGLGIDDELEDAAEFVGDALEGFGDVAEDIGDFFSSLFGD